MASAELMEIGEVVKPQGLRGRMKARSYIVSGGVLQQLDRVFIRCSEDDSPVLFKLRYIQLKKDVIFLEVDGIEDWNGAVKLVGSQILIPSEQLEALPAGEYYWHDLIGLNVLSEEGCFLGRIETIFPTGSNDVYVCSGGEREILLPAIEEVIRKIDTDQGVMIVRLLEGL
jgi:16S rRNA processing protein RimM